MKRRFKHILRNLAGVLLVLLGIVGLFLPILQGVLFIVLGLGLINLPVKHRFHRWLARKSSCYRALALRYFKVKRRLRRGGFVS